MKDIVLAFMEHLPKAAGKVNHILATELVKPSYYSRRKAWKNLSLHFAFFVMLHFRCVAEMKRMFDLFVLI